jgi:hypothetical protein
VDLVRTEVSEDPSASIIRVTRISELGTTLDVTSNRRWVPPKLQFLQVPRGVTSQKRTFLELKFVLENDALCFLAGKMINNSLCIFRVI